MDESLEGPVVGFACVGLAGSTDVRAGGGESGVLWASRLGLASRLDCAMGPGVEGRLGGVDGPGWFLSVDVARTCSSPPSA